MNKLEEYFWNGKKKALINKWHHYFKVYDRHFKKYQGQNPIILEIGVSQGGSLDMWDNYFDGDCTIYGIDVYEDCKNIPAQFGKDNIHVIIGDQRDRQFWKSFISAAPKFDIIIDDGGHTMTQQIVTFEETYYNLLNDDGVYLCEDLHTSYWSEYGGGLGESTTFIEYSKKFIDSLNAYHIRQNPPYDLTFRQHTNSIHYYDSIIVLEKKRDTSIPTASTKV